MFLSFVVSTIGGRIEVDDGASGGGVGVNNLSTDRITCDRDRRWLSDDGGVKSGESDR